MNAGFLFTNDRYGVARYFWDPVCQGTLPGANGFLAPLDRGVSCADAGHYSIVDESLCLGLASQLTPPVPASAAGWSGSAFTPEH